MSAHREMEWTNGTQAGPSNWKSETDVPTPLQMPVSTMTTQSNPGKGDKSTLASQCPQQSHGALNPGCSNGTSGKQSKGTPGLHASR